MIRARISSPKHPFLGRVAAMLALVAQLALVVAGFGEGTAGVGAQAHIDPGGTATHYVHDEALCAACQARSLHGLVRLPHPPTIAAQPRQTAAVDRPESYLDSALPLQHLSRAPPSRTAFVS
jgi:hypothetical protein